VGFVVTLALEFQRGLDITDEAFSILDAAHPEDQFTAVRFHWLFTFPVLALSFGNLWLNRILGVIILALAGCLLGSNLARVCGLRDVYSRPIAGGVGAVCMLAFYAFDLRSPSYNWCVVLGGSVVVACLAGAAGAARGSGWLFVGGLMASATAASKISAGTALAVLGLVASPWLAGLGWRGWLRGAGCWTLGILLGAVASFAFLTWWNDPVATFERGMQVLKHIGLYDDLPRSTINESVLFVRVWFSSVWLLLALSAMFGLAALVASRTWPTIVASLIPWVMPAALGLMFAWKPSAWGDFNFYAHISFGAFTVLVCVLLSVGFTILRTSAITPQMHVLWVIILLVAIVTPFATAVGTGNKMFWQLAGLASGIWLTVAAVLVMVVGRGCQTMLSARSAAVVSALIVAIGTFAVARAHPYRPVFGDAEALRRIEISPGRGSFLIDGRLATAIEILRTEASEAGFTQGQDILALYDMPGVVLVLGGRAPGASWILSGYRGCGSAAEVVLGSVDPKRLANAWVLVRSPQRAEGSKLPGANPKVSEVLAAVGLNFPGEYAQVATVLFPFYDQLATVSLWKPK
jgi:hypothetical protein